MLGRNSIGSERLLWRFNRLRCMTPAEVSHRVVQALSLHAQSAGLLGSGAVPPAEITALPRDWVHAGANLDPAPYLAAAERIAAGRLDLFALHDFQLGSPPRWNRDPKTGREAPLVFGMLLDYRDPRRVGDIKYLWELNRHLHLVTLAQAYALSGETRHFEVLRQHLENWFDACPYRMGANWTSALEAAIRLVNWSLAWQLLGGARSALFDSDAGARLRRRWLESAYQHAHFVHGNFSRYSSANNHLIGEATGLFIAGLTWPHWPRMRAWMKQAKAILEREVLLQNAPDGVNREQAAAYQHFVLDMLLLTLLAGKANGHWFSVAYESRIEAMLEYLASIMDVAGNVPMFGDADDGMVTRLAQGGGFCGYRALLAAGGALFRNADLKSKAGTLDDKTRWLLGAEADVLFREQGAAQARLPVRRSFPQDGYYVLGCDFESPDEIRLVADAGPLGYQTIAAHGHADALSFTLSVGGLDFLVDPGTYAYHTQAAWRQYFRGTAAHNTIMIDGRDQSQSGGNFMWLRKAAAGCSLWQSTGERDVFEGWHDGYTRLADPVMHSRRITLEKRPRRIVIEDRLNMSGVHEVELMFHCSERCSVRQTAEGYTLTQADRTLALTLPQADNGFAQIYCGATDPIRGWISRRFDEKLPSPTIAWRGRLGGDVVLRSEIEC
jgi:hypothetical protein